MMLELSCMIMWLLCVMDDLGFFLQLSLHLPPLAPGTDPFQGRPPLLQ